MQMETGLAKARGAVGAPCQAGWRGSSRGVLVWSWWVEKAAKPSWPLPTALSADPLFSRGYNSEMQPLFALKNGAEAGEYAVLLGRGV